MASAATVLVRIPGVVIVVLVQMLPVRVLVGLLAGCTLPRYSPGLAVLFCSGVGAVVFVMAGGLGSPCVVARHGSEGLGPHKRKHLLLSFIPGNLFSEQTAEVSHRNLELAPQTQKEGLEFRPPKNPPGEFTSKNRVMHT